MDSAGSFRIINILEKAVADAVDDILPTLSGACGCGRCRADIICLALNQLPPRYVVNRWGEIISEAEIESPQMRADIVAAVARSARKIAGRPHDDRHSRPPG